MRRRWPVVLLLGTATATAGAHDGPPYPILVDEPLDGALLSIWADPDVGVGTFYLYLEDRDQDGPLPAVHVAVRPRDQERAEATFDAVVAEEEAPYQLLLEADFDHRGPWQARFVVEEAAGPMEFVLPLDVTPPGLGAFDIAWYLSPFVAIGVLWIKVLVSRRRHRPRAAPGPDPRAPSAAAGPSPGGAGPRSLSAAPASSDSTVPEDAATAPLPRSGS